jgi:hypothetical protein
MTEAAPAGETDQREELAALWRWFADSQFTASPLYTAIAGAVADDPEILDLVLESPPLAHLPLILMAAVHYLLLGGLEHPLAGIYSGSKSDAAARAPALFRDLCLSHRREVLEVMDDRRIQTNEVGRSALIGPALTTIGRAHPQPLYLVDVGTSAGITLCCERFLLDYGPHGTTGPADSRVRVECEVRSGSPPIAGSLGPFATKVGIDLDPPDVENPDDVRWLLACIWPDTGRLERARRAITVAQEEHPKVIEGDALELLPGVLDGIDRNGTICLLTTWSFGYLSVEQRQAFVDMLAHHGARRPIVWVCGDGPGVLSLVPVHGEPGDVLSEVTFDAAGAHPRLLARVHAHGHWLDWRA